jgi:hypothetical protein
MTEKAKKLLERMRASQANWKRHDIETLYHGFGFVIKSGANHDLVFHPDFPQLVSALPRHAKIASYVVKQAVKLVDELIKLQENTDEP